MDQARYQEIALELAHSIVMGEYREGEKIHGRSTLAGRFNVSPETIRRAIAILQNAGVVIVNQGVGITVTSRAMADRFLKSFDQKGEMQVFQEELKRLLDQRREIDLKIEEYLDKVLNYAERLMSRWMDVGEIEVGTGSAAIGKTLRELKIREHTGTTIVAIVREGLEQFSPAANFILQEGDILLVVGSGEGQKKLQALLAKGRSLPKPQ
ncbi:Regulator of K+ conductance, C-terminal [Acididesulfobacillus acetoxydans]|uniref:Regulator of K+ conductance, C-terminal n=1 Tax=Acididesulfobacillus acetoxydans TaxID=1561005 RepID=A0A8S0WF54_9FIRM|nr:TrkA C-terminal domain-containing protein [Acididesulfobacillus acetoxydans]CAA7600682.1 Regulator of K+ conductance, C-terminal [Acididesulfobacillus acetoxydans]CEJ09463.1 Transcriptional regulator, GntR [Acididesulfobacillus acetoxydans]